MLNTGSGKVSLGRGNGNEVGVGQKEIWESGFQEKLVACESSLASLRNSKKEGGAGLNCG